MSENYYILVETENKNATFIQKLDEDFRFFEIFRLSNNVNFTGKVSPEMLTDFIVVAGSQEDALKKFGKKVPNLLKRTIKNYYETELLL